MTDAELIKASRKMLDLNQEPFANLIGCSVQAVQSWELGRRNPKPQAIKAILTAVISRSVSTASRQAFINDKVKDLKAKD